MMIGIEDLIDQTKADVITWRRQLHKYPELSFQEEKTAQFVYDKLCTLKKLEVSRPTKTSVMARLIGSLPGNVLAIRADMDALPMQEENSFEFTSQNPGVMHACGHDAHTAMLLGTATILSVCHGWQSLNKRRFSLLCRILARTCCIWADLFPTFFPAF